MIVALIFKIVLVLSVVSYLESREACSRCRLNYILCKDSVMWLGTHQLSASYPTILYFLPFSSATYSYSSVDLICTVCYIIMLTQIFFSFVV